MRKIHIIVTSYDSLSGGLHRFNEAKLPKTATLGIYIRPQWGQQETCVSNEKGMAHACVGHAFVDCYRQRQRFASAVYRHVWQGAETVPQDGQPADGAADEVAGRQFVQPPP